MTATANILCTYDKSGKKICQNRMLLKLSSYYFSIDVQALTSCHLWWAGRRLPDMARKMFVPRAIHPVLNRYVGANFAVSKSLPFPIPLLINKSGKECNDMSTGYKIHERLDYHGLWRQHRNLGKRGTGFAKISIRHLLFMRLHSQLLSKTSRPDLTP